MTNQRWHIWAPMVICTALSAGIFIGLKLQHDEPTIQIRTETDGLQESKLEEVLHYIDAKYVDTIDNYKLVDDALTEIVSHLDPHSEYIQPNDLDGVNDELAGHFDGIGIEYNFYNDSLLIVNVLDKSPAQKAGLQIGDKIVSVNSKSLSKDFEKTVEVLSQLRGETGTSVEVGIKRRNNNSIQKVTIYRSLIEVESVQIAYPIDSFTMYIKINSFTENTYEEFMTFLQKQNPSTPKNLILDLRDNPGGYLQEAIQILSQFFKEKDKLLVYTKGKRGNKSEYKTTGRALMNIQKIAVLVNSFSASASEILAGALQDWDRATIIGTPTFGKGLVQEQFDLFNGGALRLTVARYFLPSNRCIQKPYTNENELAPAYNIKSALDTTKFFTSKGRVVYANRGIQPDFVVNEDPIYENDEIIGYLSQVEGFLIESGEMNNYQKTYSSSLSENQIKGNELFKKFILHSKVPKSITKQPAFEKVITDELKFKLIKLHSGNLAYHQAKNSWDKTVQKGVEILEK